MIKKIFFLFTLGITPLFLSAEELAALTLEQKLKLKIIEEHWKEKDYQLAKGQIEEYLMTFPEGLAHSHLHLIVGDLYFKEKNYKAALEHYLKIEEHALLEKAFEPKLFCFLTTKNFSAIKEEVRKSETKHLTMTTKRIVGEAYFLEAKETRDIAYKGLLMGIAKKYFEELLGTPLEESVLETYAEVLRFERNFSKAADIYLKLASSSGDSKKDYFLYQAGCLLSTLDKNRAIEKLSSLRKAGSEYAFQALMKEIQILSLAKDYQALIDLADEELTSCSKNTASILHYYKGKALLCEGRIDEAILSLKTALSQELLSLEMKKKALLSLTYAAKQMKDPELADFAFHELKTHFSKDPEIKFALLTYLAQNLEGGRHENGKEALSLLKEIEEDHSTALRYTLDMGILEEKMGHYEQACSLFEQLLQEESGIAQESAKLFIKNLSLLLEENGEGKNRKSIAKRWLPTLSLLDSQSHLIDKDKEKLAFLYAKVLFDLSEKEKALSKIEQVLPDIKTEKILLLSHMLASKILEELAANPEKIVFHLEKAITLEERLFMKAHLHVKAFNTLLCASEEKAAEHLFQAFTLEPSRVENSNVLWLAHYYFKKSYNHPLNKRLAHCPEALIFAQRSLRLFLNAFDQKENRQGEPILTCARLLYELDRFSECKKLLESVVKNFSENKGLSAEIHFLLAKCSHKLFEEEASLQFLEKILKEFPPATAKIGQKAYLEKCMIQKEKMLQQNPLPEKDIEGLISMLKMLEVTRMDLFEPIGIEASLEAMELKLLLMSKERQDEEKTKYFTQLKEKYETVRDILIQKNTLSSLKTAELISLYLFFIENETKRFTGSEKADTYENQETLKKWLPLEQRSDMDAEYIRKRFYRSI